MANFRHEPMRSTVITKAAKGEPCTLCIPGICKEPDTVVFCHAPSEFKGLAVKSPDFWGAFGCFHCHQFMDGNKVTGEDFLFFWMRGVCRTQTRLLQRGLLAA